MMGKRDNYTAGHQVRVAHLAVAIAEELSLEEVRIEGLKLAAEVHDIGKIGIPAEILTKPGALSELEYKIMQTHPSSGYDILKNIDFPWPLAEIVAQHHEKIDGSGYPEGLRGDDILLEAKIICLADAVEAMASHRPYRPALGIDAALEEIERQRGTLFDENVVDACLRLFREKGYLLEQ
jgi:putative nucleotidyltransferase with HDIG domain